MEIDKLVEKLTEEICRKVVDEIKSSGGNIGGCKSGSVSNVASYLEHTILRPDATADQVKKFCQEAKDYKFATVCVSPWYVPMAAEILKSSGVKVCTVAGFPHGAASTKAKIAEVVEAIENGANEIDVAINITALKSGDFDAVKKDFEAVVLAARGKAKIKAIIETCLLTDEEKVKACTIVKMAGADFIKVSTALGTGKATVEEIKFFRQIVGPDMGIKADGGVKDCDFAAALINAGATRIGASASVAIVSSSGTGENKKLTVKDIAKMIDHSLLRPQLTAQQVVEGCKLAREYDVATVCVKPCDVALAQKELQGSSVLNTTVIGFPHGAHKTEVKVFEAVEAMKDGAVELDLVLNIGRLLGREFDYVERDIKAVVDVAHAKGVIVKVILENCYLTDELKEIACKICERAGADFVKTSTGFGTGGAAIDDLKLMRRTCSSKVRVKAAGGVRTLDAALAVRSVGTVRFGATTTKEILDEAIKREKEGTLKEVAGGELKGGY